MHESPSNTTSCPPLTICTKIFAACLSAKISACSGETTLTWTPEAPPPQHCLVICLLSSLERIRHIPPWFGFCLRLLFLSQISSERNPQSKIPPPPSPSTCNRSTAFFWDTRACHMLIIVISLLSLSHEARPKHIIQPRRPITNLTDRIQAFQPICGQTTIVRALCILDLFWFLHFKPVGLKLN